MKVAMSQWYGFIFPLLLYVGTIGTNSVCDLGRQNTTLIILNELNTMFKRYLINVAFFLPLVSIGVNFKLGTALDLINDNSGLT